MSYDGFYSDLSARGTTNQILNEAKDIQIQLELIQDNVQDLAVQVNQDASSVAASVPIVTNASDAAVAAAFQAQNSATVASGAAASVQHILPPSATDPTTRVDGSPLQVGDTYFNTTMNVDKTWTLSGWVTGGSGPITVVDGGAY